MRSIKPFETVARYYDEAYAAKSELQDVAMYKKFSQDFGGPILEIGCGTGRVLVPIAEMGLQIDGIDLSEPLLSILRDKLEAQKLNRHVEQGDMRSFNLGRQYKLVTIPFRSLQHMITTEDKIKALKNAKNHLEPNGRLIFDVAFPKYESLTSGFGQEYLDSEWESQFEDGKTVRMFFRRDGYRKKDQVMLGTLLFRVYDKETLVHNEEQSLEMHFFSLSELEALFQATGFEIEQSYGSYDFKDLDENASQMVFILRSTR